MSADLPDIPARISYEDGDDVLRTIRELVHATNIMREIERARRAQEERDYHNMLDAIDRQGFDL